MIYLSLIFWGKVDAWQLKASNNILKFNTMDNIKNYRNWWIEYGKNKNSKKLIIDTDRGRRGQFFAA